MRCFARLWERGNDPAFHWEQASRFAFFTTRLIWQRFRLPMFVQDPAAGDWTNRFDDLLVVERAQSAT